MFDPSKFVVKAAKPLPVLLLLDTSGSMYGEKIANLNHAVRNMIKAFSSADTLETEILVSIITFGPVTEYLPFTQASAISWKDLDITGDTPIGATLKKAKEIIEDKNIVPSRAYRPTVVLVSDGNPTDSWKRALQAFVEDGRSAKCDRMAMAIGNDADEEMLSAFIAGTNNKLFHADDASQIHDFFKFVTMSVTTRTKSQNPNIIPAATDLYDDL